MKLLKGLLSARGTKRALIASAACTLLCGLLLFSTSVAWFTANKESKVNELYSGNLDIELSYSKTMNNNDWHDVKDAADIFKVGDKNMLWEPGAVNVVYFKIENKGNLAAKYDFAVVIDSEVGGKNFAGTDFKLSDYIKGGVVEDVDAAFGGKDVDEQRAAAIEAVKADAQKLSEIDGEVLVDGKMNDTVEHPNTKTFALVLYMPDDPVTSEATNYKTPETEDARPKVPLKVKLVATQDVGENDSFGNQYDKGAYEIKVVVPTLPENATDDQIAAHKIAVNEAVATAVQNATSGSTIRLPEESEIKLDSGVAEKQLTIKGGGASTVIAERVYDIHTGISFENLTVDSGKFTASEGHKGFARPGDINYTNCTIKGDGLYALYGDTEIFKNCTFTMDSYEYILWTYGAKNVVFENCTFITKGKALKIYHDACTNDIHNVTLTGCTFKIAEGYTNTGNKPALAVDARGSVFNIKITDCTVAGYKFNDDAMSSWYAEYMSGATDTQKMFVGCEGTGIANVHVTIDGTKFN